MTRYEIIRGIDSELSESSKYLDFVVRKSIREQDIWKIFVDMPLGRQRGLDESYEGAIAWWGGPPKGAADVLSVVPDEQQINLRFATVEPPEEGGMIRIYPPRYLESLLAYWQSEYRADQSLRWLETMLNNNQFDRHQTPRPQYLIQKLRAAQTEAYSLAGWDAGYLWGPPGTGKTYTLGCLLSEYLIQYPSSKVLLLSTTNIAVDLALVSVDEKLEIVANSSERDAINIRKQIFRIGNHFVGSKYSDREHLIPVKDHSLVKQLAELESLRPDPVNVLEYNEWKKKVEQIRNLMRTQVKSILRKARLAALTTTGAVFMLDDLYDEAPYDLVVFDEASQIGKAHALALAPLGKKVFFAGDPKQLAPVVQSDDEYAKEWLGKSMFTYKDKTPECTLMLDEQSRMAEPISDLVSNMFYDGCLRVAEDCHSNLTWNKYRKPLLRPESSSGHLILVKVDNEGKWSHKYGGPIRYESAELIRGIATSYISKGLDEKNLLILTPFRAQRSLIKAFLRNAGLSRISVSTVHKAQGSERHTVIFDPALGDSPFLKTEDAERLINVAISRAEAQLIIMIAPGDRVNPLFDRIATVIENINRPKEAEDISTFTRRPDFPHCLSGKVVRIKDIIGVVDSISKNGSRIIIKDINNGTIRTFMADFLRSNF